MLHTDFRIGPEFYTAAGRWLYTDVGTRVIVAIRLDTPDVTWYNGPPYAVAEIVLDENDLERCAPVAVTYGEFTESMTIRADMTRGRAARFDH